MAISSRMNYTCDVASLRGITIFEYDMVGAGLNVLREKKLVSDSEGERLASLSKDKRVIAVGLLCRDNEDILRELENGTKQAVRDFCNLNDITSEDIISIKRDAVYSTRLAKKLKIGEYLNFREVDRYSSFYNFNGIEIYYSSWKNSTAIKGLGKEIEEAHRAYFLKWFTEIIALAEDLQPAKLLQILEMKRLDYLNFKIDVNCYREMNSHNMFKLKDTMRSYNLYVDTFPGIPNTDITYNYMKFVLPMISYVL